MIPATNSLKAEERAKTGKLYGFYKDKVIKNKKKTASAGNRNSDWEAEGPFLNQLGCRKNFTNQ